MRSTARTRLLLAALAVAVLAAAGAAGALLLRHRAGPSVHAGFRSATIPAAGGVMLAAEVTTPDATQQPPLVVLPASLGSSAAQYHLLAGRLANAGYAVVAYAQRGVGGSGGRVDLAGVPSRRDVSTVITWALAHTSADPRRVGLLGVSYGGGISLLAAAHDPRVRAVVALSTWTDLGRALAENRTLEVGALHQLLGPTGDAPRLDPVLARLGRETTTDPPAALAALDGLSRVRSPATYLRALNARRVPIMLANGWEDSIFPPTPLVDFFDRLTGPKRLEFGTGDHTGPESSGITGDAANRAVDGARAWLDRYVRGRTSTPLGKPVQLQDVATGTWHEYATWPAATAGSTVALTDPRSTGVGAATTRTAPWQAALRTGTDSLATSGPSQFAAGSAYRPPTAAIDQALGGPGLSWAGGAAVIPSSVAGTPVLRVSLTSSARSGTLVAYLYDVSPAGVGRLMTVTPFTVGGLSATRPRVQRVSLNPISWTIAAHHHVVLALDTADPRYSQAAPPGSTITVISTAGAPARLTVPVSP